MGKKYIGLLAICSLFMVASCGGSPTTNPTTIEPTSSPTVEPTIEPTTTEQTTTAEPTTVEPTTAKGSLVGYSFSNPLEVFNGAGYYSLEVADPSVVKADDGSLLCFSTDQRELVSHDYGCTWELVTNNVIMKPTWGSQYTSKAYYLWAPDVVKVQDQWIYYYSLSGMGNPVGIGYAVADSDELTAETTFTDMGKLFTGDEMDIPNCIDPQVFVEDDGSVYMTAGSMCGVYIFSLTEDGMALDGGIETQKEEKVLIAGRRGDWEGNKYEGAYIIKKDGEYFFFGSAGTCCAGKDSTYRVMVGRSDDIMGPYKGADGKDMALASNGTGCYGNLVLKAPMDEERYAGPGHNSILLDDAGDYWIFYHSFTSKESIYKEQYQKRHLMMDKLLWDDNGFPYVEDRNPTYEEECDGPQFLEY